MVAITSWETLGEQNDAMFCKAKLTGPCRGTLLQFPALQYNNGIAVLWVGDLATTGGGIPGAVANNYASSATYINLDIGQTMTFAPTGTPAIVHQDAFSITATIPQACFYFNRKPDDLYY